MLDTHCHVDQFPDPLHLARKLEGAKLTTVAVTNLPSHFETARLHLDGFRYVKPALGLHPLAASSHQRELAKFLVLAAEADYIGEIGLDFSQDGRATKDIQLRSFLKILPALRDRPRIITLHSRGAEEDVLKCLYEAGVGPVIFHWYSGSLSTLERILQAGHYLSFNPAMALSQRWSSWFGQVPADRVLTETDGPHVEISGKPATPKDVSRVLLWLARRWSCTTEEAEARVALNFKRLQP